MTFSFSFQVIIFGANGRLTQGSNPRKAGFFGCVSFCICVLSSFKASSGPDRKPSIWGLPAPPPFCLSHNVTRLPWTSLSLGEPRAGWVSQHPEAVGTANTTWSRGRACVLYLSPLLTHTLPCAIRLPLQNTSSNTELLGILR